jgi:hypothetical protein
MRTKSLVSEEAGAAIGEVMEAPKSSIDTQNKVLLTLLNAREAFAPLRLHTLSAPVGCKATSGRLSVAANSRLRVSL